MANRKDIVRSSSVAGQNHGAVVRAAVINSALFARDTAANKVLPGVKAVGAYGVGFVRNLFAGTGDSAPEARTSSTKRRKAK